MHTTSKFSSRVCHSIFNTGVHLSGLVIEVPDGNELPSPIFVKPKQGQEEDADLSGGKKPKHKWKAFPDTGS
jgi:hypothetical protein